MAKEYGFTREQILAELARRGVDPSAAVGTANGAPKITEDQGKAQTYARLMSGAENSYDRAVQEGYSPGSLRNTLASAADGLPLIGDGLGAFVRDKASDRAHQAELQWSDAQLKAVSGAASPEAEVRRNVQTYFPRPGENFKDIEPQKQNARRTAFESAKVRAGPVGATIGDYGKPQKPEGWTKNLPPAQIKAAMMFKGSTAPGGTKQNPVIPTSPEEFHALPAGSYYIDTDGQVLPKKGGR